MAAGSIRVKGLREFQRAVRRADKDTRKEVKSALKEVGEVVRVDAADRFDRYDRGSARSLKVSVSQRGVAVYQSRRKTTGKRPDFGTLQMRRALLPALEDKRGEAERRMERAIDRIADHFGR